MAVSKPGLCKKAAKLELDELRKHPVTPACMPQLNRILEDLWATYNPKPIDYHNRSDLVRIFNLMSREIFGDFDFPAVEEFGSFLMDVFTAESDLDLSINFSGNDAECSREKKIQTLQKFAKKLYLLQRKGHVCSIQRIFSARVPIVKAVDCGTGIECDISVENRDGVAKSKILKMISTIDGRFQKLSVVMKAWAKAHAINSSKDHTLNSISIISLVAFHLQTCDPPILPPFSSIFKEGTDPEHVRRIVKDYANYGTKNKECLFKLFFTLLIKLASVETLWKNGLCASLYEGSWIVKKWGSKVGFISVEDFTDRSENLARAVGKKQVVTIYKCIKSSLRVITDFTDGKIQGPNLRDLLFGSQTIPGSQKNGNILNPFSQAPKRKLADGWESKPTESVEKWNNTSNQAKKWRSDDNWGGKQLGYSLSSDQESVRVIPSVSWGGREVEDMRPTEGWGGREYSSSGWRSNVSTLGGPSIPFQHYPVTPLIPPHDPRGAGGQHGLFGEPSFMPPLFGEPSFMPPLPDLLSLGVSHNLNRMAPMAYGETARPAHYLTPSHAVPYYDYRSR